MDGSLQYRQGVCEETFETHIGTGFFPSKGLAEEGSVDCTADGAMGLAFQLPGPEAWHGWFQGTLGLWLCFCEAVKFKEVIIRRAFARKQFFFLHQKRLLCP